MPTVSVYVPEMVLQKAEAESKEKKISLSKVLLGNKVMEPSTDYFGKLDRIEKKLDKICNLLEGDKAKKTIREKKIESSKGKDLSSKISKADEEMLREKMSIISKKGPESLTGWQGGYSKDRQIGKKGKK